MDCDRENDILPQPTQAAEPENEKISENTNDCVVKDHNYGAMVEFWFSIKY